MKLTLKRRFHSPGYTIGTLYIDGRKFCDTLENPDRGLSADMPLDAIRAHKVHGATAIPTGSYNITVNRSPRFGRELPRLIDVPCFTGILIHAGNTTQDTSGCILVGENRAKGKVLNSRSWERRLTELLRDAEDIEIEVV